jgi:5'-3' exonuclease
MGVPRFFPWLSKKFPQSITNVKHHNQIVNEVDNLCIDCNGCYHPIAQKVYRYGEKHGLRRGERRKPWYRQNRECYDNIWSEIMSLALLTRVRKRIVLCVDGVAPHSKIVQQRQRRFKNVSSDPDVFNSNNITPGTMWMHNLSNFIEYKIREELNDRLSFLRNIEIVFSSEKVPGEGEHKIMTFIRNHNKNSKGESYCIVGLDADLVMLSLSTHIRNIYILRNAVYDPTIAYHLVNVDKLRVGLIEELSPDGNGNDAFIDDFIFFCFLVGNDFIPHSPSLEIMEDGLDILIGTYAMITKTEGYITRSIKNTKSNNKTKKYRMTFHKKNLEILLRTVSKTEKNLVESKIRSGKYIKDEILEEHAMRFIDSANSRKRRDKTIEVDVDFPAYKESYYAHHFPGISIQSVVNEYLKGLHWIIGYYTTGVANWQWKYPYYYAPFASDVAKLLPKYRHVEFNIDRPISIYKQLMCVFPKSSRDLLPMEMQGAFEEKDLQEFYPDAFEIDLSGKFREWEGIALLPFINLEKFEIVDDWINNLPDNVKRRGKFSKLKVFHYTNSICRDYQCYYGYLKNCSVSMRTFL